MYLGLRKANRKRDELSSDETAGAHKLADTLMELEVGVHQIPPIA